MRGGGCGAQLTEGVEAGRLSGCCDRAAGVDALAGLA